MDTNSESIKEPLITINDLPYSIQTEIVSYCDQDTISSLSHVNKQFNSNISEFKISEPISLNNLSNHIDSQVLTSFGSHFLNMNANYSRIDSIGDAILEKNKRYLKEIPTVKSKVKFFYVWAYPVQFTILYIITLVCSIVIPMIIDHTIDCYYIFGYIPILVYNFITFFTDIYILRFYNPDSIWYNFKKIFIIGNVPENDYFSCFRVQLLYIFTKIYVFVIFIFLSLYDQYPVLLEWYFHIPTLMYIASLIYLMLPVIKSHTTYSVLYRWIFYLLLTIAILQYSFIYLYYFLNWNLFACTLLFAFIALVHIVSMFFVKGVVGDDAIWLVKLFTYTYLLTPPTQYLLCIFYFENHSFSTSILMIPFYVLLVLFFFLFIGIYNNDRLKIIDKQSLSMRNNVNNYKNELKYLVHDQYLSWLLISLTTSLFDNISFINIKGLLIKIHDILELDHPSLNDQQYISSLNNIYTQTIDTLQKEPITSRSIDKYIEEVTTNRMHETEEQYKQSRVRYDSFLFVFHEFKDIIKDSAALHKYLLSKTERDYVNTCSVMNSAMLYSLNLQQYYAEMNISSSNYEKTISESIQILYPLQERYRHYYHFDYDILSEAILLPDSVFDHIEMGDMLSYFSKFLKNDDLMSSSYKISYESFDVNSDDDANENNNNNDPIDDNANANNNTNNDSTMNEDNTNNNNIMNEEHNDEHNDEHINNDESNTNNDNAVYNNNNDDDDTTVTNKLFFYELIESSKLQNDLDSFSVDSNTDKKSTKKTIQSQHKNKKLKRKQIRKFSRTKSLLSYDSNFILSKSNPSIDLIDMIDHYCYSIRAKNLLQNTDLSDTDCRSFVSQYYYNYYSSLPHVSLLPFYLMNCSSSQIKLLFQSFVAEDMKSFIYHLLSIYRHCYQIDRSFYTNLTDNEYFTYISSMYCHLSDCTDYDDSTFIIRSKSYPSYVRTCQTQPSLQNFFSFFEDIHEYGSIDSAFSIFLVHQFFIDLFSYSLQYIYKFFYSVTSYVLTETQLYLINEMYYPMKFMITLIDHKLIRTIAIDRLIIPCIRATNLRDIAYKYLLFIYHQESSESSIFFNILTAVYDFGNENILSSIDSLSLNTYTIFDVTYTASQHPLLEHYNQLKEIKNYYTMISLENKPFIKETNKFKDFIQESLIFFENVNISLSISKFDRIITSFMSMYSDIIDISEFLQLSLNEQAQFVKYYFTILKPYFVIQSYYMKKRGNNYKYILNMFLDQLGTDCEHDVIYTLLKA